MEAAISRTQLRRETRKMRFTEAYEKLRGVDAAMFVPGHGQPGTLGAFEQPTFVYLKTLKSHMDAAFKAGVDPSTAVRKFDSAPWRGLVNFT